MLGPQFDPEVSRRRSRSMQRAGRVTFDALGGERSSRARHHRGITTTPLGGIRRARPSFVFRITSGKPPGYSMRGPRIPLIDRLPESPVLQGFSHFREHAVHHRGITARGADGQFGLAGGRENGLVARKAFGAPWHVVSRMLKAFGARGLGVFCPLCVAARVRPPPVLPGEGAATFG